MTHALLMAAALLAPQQQRTAAAPGPVPSAAALAADTGTLRHANGRVPPVAFAARVAGSPPRVDGRLDEDAWGAAEPVTRFTQREPDEGRSPSESTEVRILYDDDALYIGARLHDSHPEGIAAQLSRRDAWTQSDLFELAIDSYHDHRTAFYFRVNPLGVRADAVFPNDRYGDDMSWDPVWEAATHRDAAGWTAEIRIPFSQLRFPNTPTQVWGVNFMRWIQRRAEDAHWGWRAQTEEGYASFFGHLFGLSGLPQPRRLELIPYATAREERIPAGTPNDPFNDGSRERAGAGLDLQYGVTSDLTLNATFNPDFGQVEADPAEVNLTVYETQFEERRPFFVEGANIFRFGQGGSIRIGGTELFYSRRVGRAPQAFADPRGGFVDAPASTTIMGAAKLSGRTAGGWALGILEALTAREYATVQDPAGGRFRDEVEPATNHAVVRAVRDFGGGASTLGLIGTAVHRSIDDARLDFLRSAAYVGGVDFTHRFDRNRYTFWGSAGVSHIAGDTLAIRLAQRSSARYFQRPDADYVDYDPSRTSLAGWTGTLGLSRDVGDWIYGLTADAASPGFEVNDLGYQASADRAAGAFFASRRWTRPGRLIRNASIMLLGVGGWNFGGDRTSAQLQLSANGTFLSYWSLNGRVTVSPRVVNTALTRGGPRGVGPASVTVGGGFGTDFRKPLVAYAGATWVRTELRGWSISPYAQVEWHPTSTVSVSVAPSYSAARIQQQYVGAYADTAATATFGRRYLFGELLQRTLDLTTRLSLTLTPNLSLQVYGQPFVSTGDYRRLKELASPGSTDFVVYEGRPRGDSALVVDPDGAGPRPARAVAPPSYPVASWQYAVRSLRGNAVLRWEYRPGSTLFLVWTTNCAAWDDTSAFDAAADLGHLCQGRSENVVAVKLNYWLSL